MCQALEYIGARVKLRRLFGSVMKKSKVDEARDTLQSTVLSHVPVLHCHVDSITGPSQGKSGPALGGTEYRLMPSACWLIVVV